MNCLTPQPPSLPTRSSLGKGVTVALAFALLPTQSAPYNPEFSVLRQNSETPEKVHVVSLPSQRSVLGKETGGSGVWTPLPFSADCPRDAQAVVLTEKGVLIVGGRISPKGVTTKQCLLYDWKRGKAHRLPSMKRDRSFCPVLSLGDGDLLAAGGFAQIKGDDKTIDATELYETRKRRWHALPPLHFPRELHTATLLSDGYVLLAGGFSNNAILDSTELYDPVAKRFKDGPTMHDKRFGQSATPLEDGVLVVGGRGPSDVSLNACERFDTKTKTFVPASPMHQDRFRHTATLLADGRLLVTGGYSSQQKRTLDTAEIYDPTTDVWTLLTAPMQNGRMDHTATLLPDGRVLIVGGWSSQKGSTLATADLFNPTDGTFSPASPLPVSCHEQAAVLLPDGAVLIIGGLHIAAGEQKTLSTVFRYQP